MSDTIHPSILHFLPFFAYGGLPEELQAISKPFADLAAEIIYEHKLEGPEASAALRKLLEAKDCAVRASLKPVADAVGAIFPQRDKSVAAQETKTTRKITDAEFRAEWQRRHGFDGDCG